MSTDVEQVKDKLNIVDVISSYIKVQKAGINFKANCPFHNEKTPSFFISPTRQSFYCFGCGEKGDIFTFVEKFEGLDFKGALQTLADRAGVKLQKFQTDRISASENKEKDKLFEIMEEATKMYEAGLEKNKTALAYLKGRGVSAPTIKKWRLGLAKDEWRNLYEHFTSKGYSEKELLDAGLIKKADSSLGQSKFYDTFRDRVIFPISDNAGRVIAFSGRAMKDPSISSGQEHKAPKYLNSPETKLFYKSEVLHGFHLAKNYIRKLNYAVLVEGQMDLIMSHQAGVLNTVASSGTALTEPHLRKIQKLSNRVVIAYDADTAGEAAAERAATLALFLGMEVKIVSLKEGEDPASIVKKNPEKWKEALRISSHFTDFALAKALAEKDERKVTKKVLEKVLPLVLLIKSDMEKTQFVKKIALKTGVTEEAVWNDLKRLPKNEKVEYTKSGETTEKYITALSLERIMAGLIFMEETKKGKRGEQLKDRWQKVSGKEKVLTILDYYKDGKESLIFEAERYCTEGDIEKIENEVLQRIELEKLKTDLTKTATLLDNKEISKKEEKEIKTKFEKIQKRIKELS